LVGSFFVSCFVSASGINLRNRGTLMNKSYELF
jgi:hypothetical protein